MSSTAAAGEASTRSAPGFRFSLRDAIVLALFALATWWLRQPLGDLAILPAMVILHFFLFCNVFRVRTQFELAWGLTFILNAAGWQLAHRFEPWALAASQLGITALVIGAELRSPIYRGILHEQIKRRTGSRGLSELSTRRDSSADLE